MAVDFLATEGHYAEHLLPIWQALPADRRGVFFLPEDLVDRVGILAEPWASWKVGSRSGLAVCASYRDLKHLRQAGRPVALSTHGAGQSYSNRHTSYPGGTDREGVVLMLVPGPHPAARNREAYPKVPVVEVGCPKLDRWHPAMPRQRAEKPVVAISFHWECRVCPETRSAWEHYRRGLAELAKREDWKVIGHAHPRAQAALFPALQAAGIETVASFSDVLERADIYCCDNSSTLFEFASTGRPVLVLNAPWYRRHVRHGLRFWECATVGVQVDRPEELAAGIERALLDAPFQRQLREAAVRRVYTACDGQAAVRAAEAILRAAPEVRAQPPARAPQAPGGVVLEALGQAQGPWGLVDRGWRVAVEERQLTVYDEVGRARVVPLRNPVQPEEFARRLGRQFKRVEGRT